MKRTVCKAFYNGSAEPTWVVVMADAAFPFGNHYAALHAASNVSTAAFMQLRFSFNWLRSRSFEVSHA